MKFKIENLFKNEQNYQKIRQSYLEQTVFNGVDLYRPF